VEWAVKKLPDGAQGSIQDAVRAALMKAVQAALWTMEDRPHEEASPWLHKAMAATTGAVSGFFGLPAMLVELPGPAPIEGLRLKREKMSASGPTAGARGARCPMSGIGERSH
jgi:hypothetical protein